jgi:hypothetical protein
MDFVFSIKMVNNKSCCALQSRIKNKRMEYNCGYKRQSLINNNEYNKVIYLLTMRKKR